MIRMTVHGMTMDPATNSPILVLKSEDEQYTLPIWIGLMEATAIASELEEVVFSRPMTHDLLRNVIETLGRSVSKVEITSLQDNTFYASITLIGSEGPVSVDARPSDAIALALRAGAPVFVALQVLEDAAPERGGEPRQNHDDKWQEMLEKMNPEDFGKYKM